MIVSPANIAKPINMPFGLWTRAGPRNHALDDGPDPPVVSGNYEGGRAAHCKGCIATVHVQWQCGLLSNYFDHLLSVPLACYKYQCIFCKNVRDNLMSSKIFKTGNKYSAACNSLLNAGIAPNVRLAISSFPQHDFPRHFPDKIHQKHFQVFGPRPSDHYFRSVCLSVCLFV